MKEKNKCLICDRITKIKDGTNPYFVREMKTGYVVIGDHQFYKGYTLFLAKEHVSELHQLSDRSQFLEEMATVAEAVYEAFKPVKLNYELLGNSDSHVHWHLFPRHKDDPNIKDSVWAMKEFAKNNELTIKERDELIKKLDNELEKLL